MALVWVGRVTHSHGIRGEVKIYCPDGERGTFRVGMSVLLENQQGQKSEFTVTSVKCSRQGKILGFSGIHDGQEARRLIGNSVFVQPQDLQALSANEYYWYQLQGLEVKTEKGNSLGRVKEVFFTGAHDVFVVREKQKDILVPAIEDVIQKVDLENKYIIIRPIQGLLSENDL